LKAGVTVTHCCGTCYSMVACGCCSMRWPCIGGRGRCGDDERRACGPGHDPCDIDSERLDTTMQQ